MLGIQKETDDPDVSSDAYRDFCKTLKQNDPPDGNVTQFLSNIDPSKLQQAVAFVLFISLCSSSIMYLV